MNQVAAAAGAWSIPVCSRPNHLPSNMARFLVAALLVSCIATVACRQQPVYPKLNVPVHTNKDNRGISPCAIGPSFWCRDQRNQDACGVTDLNVGWVQPACMNICAMCALVHVRPK
jgi:Saposin A-type domain